MVGHVYSSLKPLAFPDRLQAIAGGKIPAPVHVRIKPTNVCNHSCYFCAYRNDGLSLGNDMMVRDRIPREKMQEICADLIAMDVKAVTFSGGGEPLIYPYIAETITTLAKGDIHIGMLSNGSRLRGKAADAMAEHGTWLRVSIDGWDGASYARYRSVEETEFAKVIDNLHQFSKRQSRCTLGASVIIDKDNAAHLFELCSILKNAGVVHAKLSPCILKNDGAENNRYHVAFASLVEEQIDLCNALNDEHFRIINHYHRLDEMFHLPYQTCHMAKLLTVIGADSVVYTCQDKAYTESGKLGSIKDKRFKEFWFSDENQSSLCAVNPSKDCTHHCVAASKLAVIDDFINLHHEHIAFV